MNIFLHHFLSLSLFVTLLSACSNLSQSVDLYDNDDQLHGDKLSIIANNVFISEDDAVRVALLYNKRNDPFTKSSMSNREVCGVQTLQLSDGQPCIYVINYANKQGFTLVSATRHYYPILANSDKGNFDEVYTNSGIRIWLSEQKACIEYSLKQAEGTNTYTELWKSFENHSSSLPTKSDDINTVRSAFISQYENNGYDCYSLSDLEGVLPSSIYDSWCVQAEALSNPNYNYLYTSIVTRYVSQYHSVVGPLTTTKWGQDSPYNYLIPGNKLIGCVAVAMGQIMRKHEYPSSISWNNMPDSLGSTPSFYVANLLYQLAEDVHTQYGYSSSIATDTAALNVLKNKYDYYANWILHSDDSTRLSISEGNPVYTGGYVSSSPTASGHSWVCDGFDDVTLYYTYQLHIVSISEPLHYEQTGQPYYNNSQYTYWRYNWGFKGNGDGFYLTPQYNISHIYAYDRTDMIIRKKN